MVYKGLQITYNFLNLPELIQKGAASLDITYDASGRKWKQIGPNGIKEYINGIEYVDGTTESYTDQDGRVVPVIDNGSTTYRSEYFITDHLGNVRVSFADLNNNGKIEYDNPATLEVMQVGTQWRSRACLGKNHYYPFGLNHLGPWYESVSPDNKYQYNGKELVDDLDLGWMDYGARWYDAAIGRWNHLNGLK